jgi:hypothetical protein
MPAMAGPEMLQFPLTPREGGVWFDRTPPGNKVARRLSAILADCRERTCVCRPSPPVLVAPKPANVAPPWVCPENLNSTWTN